MEQKSKSVESGQDGVHPESLHDYSLYQDEPVLKFHQWCQSVATGAYKALETETTVW